MKLLLPVLEGLLCITLVAGEKAPEKPPGLELRLRQARLELIAVVKSKGLASLPKWHFSKDWVTPPPGAADYFRRDGRDIFGECFSEGEDASVTFTTEFARDAKGTWDLGVFRESKELRRIFDAAEVKRVLRRGDRVFASVSYGYMHDEGFSDPRGPIYVPQFFVMFDVFAGEGEARRGAGYISISMASGLDPVDETKHYTWRVDGTLSKAGKRIPGDGEIASRFPKTSGFHERPMLHDSRTGKAMPGFRVTSDPEPATSTK